MTHNTFSVNVGSFGWILCAVFYEYEIIFIWVCLLLNHLKTCLKKKIMRAERKHAHQMLEHFRCAACSILLMTTFPG
jgi:hypothetical protein